jgi:hypothetical protein
VEKNKTYILSTAYYPPISYFNRIINSDEVFIEANENFTKQSFRNRAEIASSNGKLSLSIPIIKNHNSKIKIKDVKIDYSENWQKNHFKAIESAYRNAPFYEYFIDEFISFFANRPVFLFDLNMQITNKIIEILKIDKRLEETNDFLENYCIENDFRNIIHPKNRLNKQHLFFKPKKYYQVFESKQGFIENLSILDLIFNMGNESRQYL